MKYLLLILISVSCMAQTDGCVQTWHATSHQYSCDVASSAGLPSGGVVMVTSGSCAATLGAGWTELAIGGSYLLATVAASGDVGTTGGSLAYTPAGTVAAPTFTGDVTTVPAETVNSLTAAAQTFTGSATTVPALAVGTLAAAWPVGVPTFSGTPFSSVINHTHTVTMTWNVQGGTTAATTGTHVMTSTATGGSARVPTTGDVVSAVDSNPAGGVASITPAGTNAWPAGVPTLSGSTATGSLTPLGANGTSAVSGTLNSTSITPLGHNAIPAFTGSPATIQPTYVKVIFCKKT